MLKVRGIMESNTVSSEAWLNEASRRATEMVDGKEPGIPAEEVFRQLDEDSE